MIGVLHIILDFYFASLLAVSGFAKAYKPAQFAATLRQQDILPVWSSKSIGYTLPWIEMGVAALLVVGTIPVLTAVTVLVLFTAFLIAESALYFTKYQGECGCYGTARTQPVTEASVITSAILVCLAALHLWISTQGPIVGWQLRAAIIAISIAVGIWYVRHVRRHARRPPSQAIQQTASSLQNGDQLPIELGIPLAPRAFLTVVSGKCNPCVRLCEELVSADLGEWSLIMMILDATASTPNNLPLAPDAQVVYDPERRHARALGVFVTPTALALVEGRVVDQRTAPPLAWFAGGR